MTKPKIANGNSLNPLSRLEKRLEECKNHHNESISNCNKIQEAHNKINLELKLSLERKSKISDSKVKKKRSTNGTAVNRKKSKIMPEKTQSKQYLDNCLESTPHASLNVHSSEFPDIDLDTFDILKDSNFPMSINEQELDNVLNNCCAQTSVANDLFSPQMPSDHIYAYKLSTQSKMEPLTPLITTNKFKTEESANTPLFPPPEVPVVSSRLSSNANVDYSSLSYLPTNSSTMSSNYGSAAVSVKSESIKYPPSMYSTNQSYNNYQYGGHVNHSISQQQYFYQYVNYSDLPTGNAISSNSFQLPTMSSGWYNNPPVQPVKQVSLKAPSSSQYSVNTVPTTSSTYLSNYGHYQLGSDGSLPCQQQQQLFAGHGHSYDQSANQSYAMAGHNYPLMAPDHSSYYYVDYGNTAGASARPVTNGNAVVAPVPSTNNNNNAHLMGGISSGGPPDSSQQQQFLTSHHNRNIYPSHCI